MEDMAEGQPAGWAFGSISSPASGQPGTNEGGQALDRRTRSRQASRPGASVALTHLVDTSVLTRLGAPSVRSVVEPLAAAGRLGRAGISDLEVGFSARNLREWDGLQGALRASIPSDSDVPSSRSSLPRRWLPEFDLVALWVHDPTELPVLGIICRLFQDVTSFVPKRLK